MKQEQAVELAQRALIWLAGEPEALHDFLGASGAGPAELRVRAQDPEFLGFLLEHMMQSDAMILAFARDAGVSPDMPARARASLPGGSAPNWT